MTLHRPEQVNPSSASLTDLGALDDEGPVIMLNLLDYNQNDGREIYGKYAAVAIEEITRLGGRPLFVGDTPGDVETENNWDSVAIIYYPSRAAYLAMQDSAAYRAVIPHRTEGLSRRLLHAFKEPRTGRPEFKTVVAPTAETLFALQLFQINHDVSPTEYWDCANEIEMITEAEGGRVHFTCMGDLPLVAEVPYQFFTLIEYPTVEARKVGEVPDTKRADWISKKITIGMTSRF